MAMSGYSSYIQNPLFAPASSQQQNQQQQGDDFDVNEIFADYFINEFNDPLNAYTSSMANYNGATVKIEAPAAAVAGVGSGASIAANLPGTANHIALPTGGIKTPFRLGAAVAGVVQQQPLKKARHDGPSTQNPVYTMQTGVFPVASTQGPSASIATPPTAGLATAGGIRVPLPVGVGIRMGGIGGVAPATAYSADRSATVLHSHSHLMGGCGDNSGGQPAISDKAIAERRQRNREHAKRSRVRKKFMLESLQEQVSKLQRVNQALRLLIQESIPTNAQEIITECCSKNPLFADDPSGDVDDDAVTKLIRSDFSLMDSLSASQQNFCLSDPRLPDNPVVFASPGFYNLTGYTAKEVLGRNCRFLQGPGTDTKTVEIIRKAVAIGADCTVCILNYKADGTPFWNQFFVAALRDSDNNIVNYVGVQCEVEPEAGASVLEDRVNEVLPLQNKDEC